MKFEEVCRQKKTEVKKSVSTDGKKATSEKNTAKVSVFIFPPKIFPPKVEERLNIQAKIW